MKIDSINLKTNNMKKILLLLMTILLPMVARAYDACIGGIYYNLSGDKTTVTYKTTSYNSYSGDVIIPPAITYGGYTYYVSAIGYYAFSDCTGLTSISIPEGVTSIGRRAFYDCHSLTAVSIPKSVTTIGYQGFLGCTGLNKVEYASIEDLCKISFGSQAANPLNCGHFLYINGTRLTDIVVPENVTAIKSHTFIFCHVNSISLHENIKSIGIYAFAGSTISSIIIPNTVSSIGKKAFTDCNNLGTISIGRGVTSIGESAFSNCPCLSDFYCNAVDVPATSNGVFTSTPINSATLHVPAGSVESYRTTSPWNSFGLIVAIGEEVSPETVEIASTEDLVDFASRVNAGEISLCAVLTDDIDLNGVAWTPIGNSNTKYAGIFDGQGHAITGFNYTATSNYNGLFGNIINATIKNFSISGNLTSTYGFNGVVGNADGASFVCGIHSSLTINVSNCKAHTGGVVGGTSGKGHTLLVENCEYSGTLTHSGEGDCQGGIIGYTYHGGVRNCIFCGTIIGKNSMYGGILAYCKIPDFLGVQNCLSVGKIVAEDGCTTAAAIIGNWNGNATGNVKNNYYCLQEGSTTTIAIGNNTQNCEAPHEVTAEQLASGEICYALNGDQSDINWYQTLNEDAFPVPDNSHQQVKFINGSYTNGAQYTITFDTNGGSPIGSITQYPGTTITPPENPTREGYTFVGWEPAIPETMPVGGLRVVAQWQVNSYTLAYMLDGNVYKTYSVNYGTEVTPEPAPTKEGYTFSGWNNLPTTMPAYNVTVTGSFSINSYRITYMVDGQVYKTDSIAYGAKITPEPAPNKEGYTFSGWTYIPATMPATDIVVMGTFTINSYTLTYMVDGKEYKTSMVTYGSAITPEAEPTKDGYTFSGWSEIPETMPAHNIVITGKFTVNSYTLLYIIDGEEYKTASVAYGTAITPEPAPTKEGYTFSGWSYIPDVMPAEDVTVTGSFTINSYTLTYKIDGWVYKTTMVDYGTALTPESAPTKKGMTFSGWGDMPETMPAHNLTLSGTYSWSRETVDGIIYEVTDTLSNYASVIGSEGEEVTILSVIMIGDDVYTVNSIANNAVPKTTTINTSVGRLLLWLWTNGYINIMETETGRNLTAPEMYLANKTASSLKLSFANPYPELTETVKVSGSTIEKGENGYEVALKGLEPDYLYNGLASVTLTFEDASYTKSYSFRTEPLTLTALQPKVVSLGNVIVAAESNLDDEETNVGFEWRRIDWTDDFESRSGAAYLYEGIMEGYIRSLNADRLWKFRPYYTSNAGNTYYSDWKGMDPSDYSFLEPTVHTYAPIAVTDSTAEVKGYAMQGTDEVASQGFMYWTNSSPASSRMRANGVPVDASVVEVPGHVMKTTLAGLDYDTEYCFVAFVKTADGQLFCGEQQSFRTGSDPDGIKDIEHSPLNIEEAWYSLDGKKLAKPQRGINIIRYSDGTTRKIMIKQY